MFYILTCSSLGKVAPSGPKAGAGKVSQSTSSQKSLDQSADHTLTRLSALVANQSKGAEIPTSWCWNEHMPVMNDAN